MKTPFPDQIIFLTNIRKALCQIRNIICCAATGFGKTFVFLTIADGAKQKGSTTLIITESTKIHKGIRKERPDAIIIDRNTKFLRIEPGQIYIAMAQSLSNRPNIISQFAALANKLIIINDEAHIGTATALIQQMPDAYLLGFTATPDYRFAKHLPLLYSDIVVGPQPQELVEFGRLTPYYHYEKRAADLSGLRKSYNGEFTEKSNEFTFDRAKVYSGFEADVATIKPKKGVVFCTSIAHANHVAEGLRGQGYGVALVHTANKQGDYELFQFESDPSYTLCVTVDQITRGWDFPGVRDIFLLRAFGSLPNYLQCIGRASRVSPGKTSFRVWDYGENATRHGLWSEDRPWKTMWLPSKKKVKAGVAPVKECPQCYLLNHSSAPTCRECGYIFPRTEQEEAEGEMVAIMAEYDGLRGRMLSTLSPPELTIYARTTNKRNYCTRIARTLDASKPGYLSDYGHLMGYKSGWAKYQESHGVGFSDVQIR